MQRVLGCPANACGIIKVGAGASTPSAPANTSLPTISDTTPVLGQELTGSRGAWTGNPFPTYAYQWLRDDADISGATSTTYTVVEADVGAVLKFEVSATNSEGGPVVATSVGTTAVASPPVNTVAPTIDDTTPTVGEELTGSIGTWTGSPTPSYAYRWLANDVAISGATSTTYTPVEADEGDTLKFEVSGTNSAGGPVVATSAATSAVSPASSWAYDQSLLLDNTGATGGQNDAFETKAAAAGSNALFAITPTTAFSISLWLKYDSVNRYNTIWGKQSSGFVGYVLNYYGAPDNIYRALIGQSGFITCDAATSITTGVWTHLVLTKSTSAASTGTKIYLNGADATSSHSGTAAGTLVNDSPLTFAGISIGGGYNFAPFDGYMQNASYWSKELSSAEVTALYNSGAPTDLTGSSNLEGWWRMGNTVGDNATAADGIKDSSGNGRDLSSRNSPAFATDGP